MGLNRVTPGPRDPQRGDTLIFTQPPSDPARMGALARKPGTQLRRGQAEGGHGWLQ